MRLSLHAKKGSQAHHACEPFFSVWNGDSGMQQPLPIFPHVGKPDATCSIVFSHTWENVPQHALPADGKRTFAHSAIDRLGIKKKIYGLAMYCKSVNL